MNTEVTAEMKAEIEQRIRKARNISHKIDELTGKIDDDQVEELIELVRERLITDIMIELQESLRDGDTLEGAIEGIHVNF